MPDPEIRETWDQGAELQRGIRRLWRTWEGGFTAGRLAAGSILRRAWYLAGSRQLGHLLGLVLILLLVVLVQGLERIAAAQDIQGYAIMKALEARGLGPRQAMRRPPPAALEAESLAPGAGMHPPVPSMPLATTEK